MYVEWVKFLIMQKGKVGVLITNRSVKNSVTLAKQNSKSLKFNSRIHTLFFC